MPNDIAVATGTNLQNLRPSPELTGDAGIPGGGAYRAKLGRMTARFAGCLGAALLVGLAVATAPVQAQQPNDNARAARAGAVARAQRMRQLFPEPSGAAQQTPAVIPEFEIDRDPSGAVATVRPGGPTITAKSPFFQNLGTNGRTCFTCHQPADGWAISASHVRRRFEKDPTEPLFRRVDGATCPSDDVSTPAARRKAYHLLLEKGLIRIGLPMPAQTARRASTSRACRYSRSGAPRARSPGKSSRSPTRAARSSLASAATSASSRVRHCAGSRRAHPISTTARRRACATWSSFTIGALRSG